MRLRRGAATFASGGRATPRPSSAAPAGLVLAGAFFLSGIFVLSGAERLLDEASPLDQAPSVLAHDEARDAWEFKVGFQEVDL